MAMVKENFNANSRHTLGKPRKTFEEWMCAVDLALQDICGMTSMDIDDYCYHDQYTAGRSAKSTAHKAYKAAGGM